jgi:pimeloyl-ACP methyl ester carboxylesterase
MLYQKPRCWNAGRRITAPVMWVEGDRTDVKSGGATATRARSSTARLAVVPRLERHVLSPAGHMLHHDQPERAWRSCWRPSLA